MTNLVMGVARGYDWKKLRPFVDSLRTHSDCKIVLFVSDPDSYTKTMLESKNVTMIPFKKIGRETMQRYFLYLDYLMTHRSFEKIMVCDTADVLFQYEPFSFDEHLIFSLEDSRMTIGTCPFNSAWTKELYGEEGLAEMYNKNFSCAGVTCGKFLNMHNYIYQMCKRLKKLDLNTDVDQAIHNYLMFTHSFPEATIYFNGQGHVLTTGYMLPETIKFKDGNVLNSDGTIPAIVHQYNRQGGLFDASHNCFSKNT